MQKVGEFLKEKRKAAAITTRQLAEKAHVSNAYITRLEKGQNTPTLDVTDRLITALGSDWIEFLLRTGYLEAERLPRLNRASEEERPYKAPKKPRLKKPS